MNDNIIYDISSPSFQPPTYAEVLNTLGSQIMDRFLLIGVITLICALWFIFDGHKREDNFSQQFTGALMYLLLCSGLVSIIFWMIAKGWIKV